MPQVGHAPQFPPGQGVQKFLWQKSGAGQPEKSQPPGFASCMYAPLTGEGADVPGQKYTVATQKAPSLEKVHVSPAAHVPLPSHPNGNPVQAPLEQALPLGELPLAAHCGVPDAHDRVPVLQIWDGLQLVPSVQLMHCPLGLHTLPAPQLVPLGRDPVSTQTAEPLKQSVEPLLHGELGVQLCPCAHAMHLPEPSHTCPCPHDTPAGVSPVSLHVAFPLWQSTVAV